MKSTQNQPRSITISMFMLVAIGGIGYLIALNLQPQWMQDLFQWLSPTIPGLVRAEQVAKHFGYSPLSAQVNVFYAVFAPVAWTPWFCYLVWREREYMTEKTLQNYQKRDSKQPSSLRLLFSAMLCVPLTLVGYWYWFSEYRIQEFTWRDASIYSGSLSSFIFSMGMTFLASIMIPIAYLFILLIFKIKEVKNG